MFGKFPLFLAQLRALAWPGQWTKNSALREKQESSARVAPHVPTHRGREYGNLRANPCTGRIPFDKLVSARINRILRPKYGDISLAGSVHVDEGEACESVREHLTRPFGFMSDKANRIRETSLYVGGGKAK